MSLPRLEATPARIGNQVSKALLSTRERRLRQHVRSAKPARSDRCKNMPNKTSSLRYIVKIVVAELPSLLNSVRIVQARTEAKFSR
mmetsp:Transcript_24025/g.44590  ORF Transcript_24025/g.44590 Transcript_24025/m.44590 type:complete len:86 (+) Transcript_24025:165-422(+)